MNDDTQWALSAFYLACAANQEIRGLLPLYPSASELAYVLKQYAFQEIIYSNPLSHHFLVTLLDTIDWTFLAERLLATNADRMKEPTNGRMPSFSMPFKAA